MPLPRQVLATRYVAPLREGGSLPAIVEADDDGMYVVKFRGAGQGPKALIAELVAGEIGRALGLPVPEMVLIEIDLLLGRGEPDPEIQDLLEASVGVNVGIDFLPGALAYGAAADVDLDSARAADIVWFDAFTSNVDRTPRNPNLLVWHRQLWLIDHGAALYLHHSWSDRFEENLVGAALPFAVIRDHMLLPVAGSLPEADARLASRITPAVVRSIVDQVPADWLIGLSPFASPERHREAYVAYLLRRLDARQAFVDEAERARQALAIAERRDAK